MDDRSAHIRGNSLNALSLWDARTAYLVHGAINDAASGLVRKPAPVEIRTTPWRIWDSRAVEAHSFAHSAWVSLFADSALVGIFSDGSTLTLRLECNRWVECLYVEGENSSLEIDVLFVGVAAMELIDFDSEKTNTEKFLQRGNVLQKAHILSESLQIDFSQGQVKLAFEWSTLRLARGGSLSTTAIQWAKEFFSSPTSRLREPFLSCGYECACCGCLSLRNRGDGCRVCFWFDDNSSDSNAHVYSTSNRMTLWEGRANYLKIGAMSEQFLKSVRPAGDRERQTKPWRLVDGQAIEVIEGDVAEIWRYLANCQIVDVRHCGDAIRIVVEIDSLGYWMATQERTISVTLFHVRMFALCDNHRRDIALTDFLRNPNAISSATLVGDRVSIVCGSGQIEYSCRWLTVKLGSGASLSVAAIRDARIQARRSLPNFSTATTVIDEIFEISRCLIVFVFRVKVLRSNGSYHAKVEAKLPSADWPTLQASSAGEALLLARQYYERLLDSEDSPDTLIANGIDWFSPAQF